MSTSSLNSSETHGTRATFINEAIWHGSLEKAEEILANYPDLKSGDIHIAAILGEHEQVKQFLDQDISSANAISEPYGCNALVYLSLSKYLRLAKRPAEDFLKAAKLLLDAGADANSGFWTTGNYSEFETALYGAAGVAQHPGLTALLLEYGADPNDGEACYHSPETWDNGAMELLVKTGKLTASNLSMMLIRKTDFHDYDGAKFLLDNGADPNFEWRPGVFPIHHALSRANRLEIIELLIDYGADVNVISKGLTAIAHAAWEGRSDVLKMLKQRGIPLNLTGLDNLIAACAEDDAIAIKAIPDKVPRLLSQLQANGGVLLARFASNGNAEGVRNLLGLGIDVNTPFAEGDAYFEIPKKSLPIHIAAWRMYPGVVKLLIERGAIVDQPDANGNTPLMLAVKACVASYWTVRRSPEAVETLLEAGASVENIPFPSGYTAVDELLEKHLT
jgi:ankyrin repeat protein